MVSDTSAMPKRLAPIRAVEDDIGHLAAAQRLGRLLAQDPTDGVRDIGLAAPIGADDGRDARAENRATSCPQRT